MTPTAFCDPKQPSVTPTALRDPNSPMWPQQPWLWALHADLEWDVGVLQQEHLELADTDTQVTIGELIWDVESQGSKLASLQQHAVEQAQWKQQVLEFCALWKAKS